MLAALLLAAPLAFGQDIRDLQRGVDDFSSAMAKAMPFNSTLGLNWSDAYIGQLLDVPPHFGAGVFMGAALIPAGDIKALAGVLDAGIPGDLSRLPYPGFGAEARLGGFFLPFDLGLKAAVLPSVVDSFDLHHFLIGGDIRYALLKGNAVLPKISLGLGLNFMKGGLGIDAGNQELAVTGSNSLYINDPTVTLTWQTLTLDLKAQVSKSFIIFTPYLGLGLTHGWSKAGYEVDSTLKYGTTGAGSGSASALDSTGITDINTALSGAGLDTIDFDGSGGFSSIIENTRWGLRLFGGIGFNLTVIKIDFTGLYNFNDQTFGFTLGGRFQL
jgi:hypothetical protein